MPWQRIKLQVVHYLLRPRFERYSPVQNNVAFVVDKNGHTKRAMGQVDHARWVKQEICAQVVIAVE